MPNTDWKPHVTVAAVIQREGRFLMVEELIEGAQRLNQPAGHLECGESLEQAVIRETYEETGFHFQPTGLLAIYHCLAPVTHCTYIRFAFTGEITGHDMEASLDEGILQAVWLSLDEVRSRRDEWRSEMVGRCLDDWAVLDRLPLSVLQTVQHR